MNIFWLTIKGLFQNAAYRRRFLFGTNPDDNEYRQWLLLMGISPIFINESDKYYGDYPNPTNKGIDKISYPRKTQTQKSDGINNVSKQINPGAKCAMPTVSPRLFQDNTKVPNYQRDDNRQCNNNYKTKPTIVINETKNGTLVKNYQNLNYESAYCSGKLNYISHFIKRIIRGVNKGVNKNRAEPFS